MHNSVLNFRAKDDAASLGPYRDQRFKGSLREQEMRLATSKTLYVGNMSYYTTEEQGSLREQEMRLATSKTLYVGNMSYYTTEEQNAELSRKVFEKKL
ncbi:unnamed protein product [Gongylonema pulchrum]|uniref:Nuclear cap-binding protein subunit 2 n=1 Tax=Gongylonema pulchrum TaxID=637853 RepID=A0A183ELL5_9BILA|nr:unnamed protein product [Gongylonema pulchrum]